MSSKFSIKQCFGRRTGLVILIAALVLIAAVWAAMAGAPARTPQPTVPDQTALQTGPEADTADPAQQTTPRETAADPTQAQTVPGETSAEPTAPAYTVEPETGANDGFTLESGLKITRYGKYIGLYMEDGSDEFVSNVMMIEVRNAGDQAVQYARITLTGAGGDAVFALTTLLPGESAVVLEADRKPYADTDAYTRASADSVAFFTEPPSLQEDLLQIQPLDGGFNLINISGKDITGDIHVYFKDMTGDMYYGGITYMCNIAGGVKANEIKQIMSSNFTDTNSRVVFITIGQ